MAISNIDQNRNATPSWSGYIHQGKVGFLVALRQLRECIENNIENLEDYAIRYENAEDFDIVGDDNQVLSRHQVKAYVNGNERENYSDLFNIQTRKFEKGKEKINVKGYQVHEFDGSGNVAREVVSKENIYLHVIVDVPDFNLSKDDYFKKYPSRTKYTDNISCVRLYKYNQANDLFYCPLSQENDDIIKDYCIAEIKEILKLKGNSLNDSDSHLEQVYLRYVGSLLDHSIGEAHSESGFPEISFGKIISIIEEEVPKDEVYEMKNNLIYRWEKYHCDYANDISEEDFKLMDEINNHLLSLTKDEFYEFVRMMLPHENSDENFLDLFRKAPIEDIFYVLLEKFKGFSFKAYSYLDNNEKSYRTSLISIQDRPGRIAKIIQEIIDNSEFLKATFNHDFLINRDIDELHIWNKIDEFDGMLDNRYREEWSTGVQHNIFKSNMEFISIKEAKEKGSLSTVVG